MNHVVPNGIWDTIQGFNIGLWEDHKVQNKDRGHARVAT